MAQADDRHFLALLNAGQEVPPGTSGSLGVAFLTLRDDDMLCVSMSFLDLSSTQVAAHIHGPAGIGVNAEILFPLENGSPISQCVGPLDKDQRKALRDGQLYVNVHSQEVQTGEIRGQIVPAAKK
jgi:hypothetical protein